MHRKLMYCKNCSNCLDGKCTKFTLEDNSIIGCENTSTGDVFLKKTGDIRKKIENVQI